MEIFELKKILFIFAGVLVAVLVFGLLVFPLRAGCEEPALTVKTSFAGYRFPLGTPCNGYLAYGDYFYVFDGPNLKKYRLNDGRLYNSTTCGLGNYYTKIALRFGYLLLKTVEGGVDYVHVYDLDLNFKSKANYAVLVNFDDDYRNLVYFHPTTSLFWSFGWLDVSGSLKTQNIQLATDTSNAINILVFQEFEVTGYYGYIHSRTYSWNGTEIFSQNSSHYIGYYDTGFYEVHLRYDVNTLGKLSEAYRRTNGMWGAIENKLTHDQFMQYFTMNRQHYRDTIAKTVTLHDIPLTEGYSLDTGVYVANTTAISVCGVSDVGSTSWTSYVVPNGETLNVTSGRITVFRNQTTAFIGAVTIDMQPRAYLIQFGRLVRVSYDITAPSLKDTYVYSTNEGITGFYKEGNTLVVLKTIIGTPLHISPSVFQLHTLEPNITGSFFTVNVTVENANDLYMAVFDLSYDPKSLNVTKIEKGGFLDHGGDTYFINGTINYTSGCIDAITYALLGEIAGVNGSGTLARITFEVLASASSRLNLSNTALLSSCNLDILHVVEDGDVIKPGDCDGDNDVDYRDLFFLARRYGSQEGAYPYDSHADFNSDGKIDYKDLFILARNYGKGT